MKKILHLLLLFIIPLCAQCQLDTINTGTSPNSGTGDTWRNAMIKTNRSITELNRIGIRNITSNYQEINILDGALVNVNELNELVGFPSVDTIASKSYARYVSGAFQRLTFIIGGTTNAPSVDSTTITHGAFMNSYVEIYRAGSSLTNAEKVFGFIKSDSTITLFAPFVFGEKFEILVYPTRNVQQIYLR